MDNREIIAQRAAKLLEDGDFVNLGIGIPTLCTAYLPEGADIIFHSENGIVGMGPRPDEEHIDPYIVDAGATAATIIPGGSSCDLAMSFAIMRGGHLNKSIVGALQVDVHGSFASWEIPGKRTYGMGGAMDLAVGAKVLIVAMEHCLKNGKSKILKECTYPLTGKGCVKYIVTELCTFACGKNGLTLIELAPGVTLQQVTDATEAPFDAGKFTAAV